MQIENNINKCTCIYCINIKLIYPTIYCINRKQEREQLAKQIYSLVLPELQYLKNN